MPDRIDRPTNVTIGAISSRTSASGTTHRALGSRVAQGIADGAAGVDPPPHGAAAPIDLASLKLRLAPGASRSGIARRFREALARALREQEGRH